MKAGQCYLSSFIQLEKTELGGPSEFEIITAMAIYYFGEMHPVDLAIFEVGLGGRFDSTNVIHSITRSHYEYWLGPCSVSRGYL